MAFKNILRHVCPVAHKDNKNLKELH